MEMISVKYEASDGVVSRGDAYGDPSLSLAQLRQSSSSGMGGS